jgi:integrase
MTKPKTAAVSEGPFRIFPRKENGEDKGVWFLSVPPRYSPTGKRQRLTFQTKSAAVAEARRMLRELRLEGAIRGDGPKLSGVTFAEIAERWQNEQAGRVARGQKRAISLTTQAYLLRSLLAEIGHLDLTKITSKTIGDYQLARQAKRKANPTINSETAVFVQIMTWAAAHQIVTKVPKFETLPVRAKKPDLPEPEEVARILEHLPPRTALLVRFLAETGCRKGEAFNLESEDLDDANALVHIRAKAGWTPKTASSERLIAVSPGLMADLVESARDACREALAHRWPASKLVFPGRNGVRMTDFDKALRAAVKKAGVLRDGQPMHLTPHMLRKANATWLARARVPDAILQPRLGHVAGSKITAKTYVHMDVEDQRSAVIDLAARRRKGTK